MAALLLTVALAGAGCGAADDGGGGGKGRNADAGAAAPQDAAGGQGAGEAGRDAAAGAAEGRADGSAAKEAEGGKGSVADTKLAPHIIRTATLRIEVESVPAALDEVRTAVEKLGGLVGSETTDRDGQGNERSRIVLRVPVNQYGAVLEDLTGTGKQLERSERAEDVTEQVVDVESRIQTQRASVARIRDLMDRATKLSDVVTLESELSTRQADLESLLAQQASLKDRASLATITLHLTESEGGQDKDDDSAPVSSTRSQAAGTRW